jgi:antitoxin PrlF
LSPGNFVEAACRLLEMDSVITSKGQATIPKAIRLHLGLKPGDRVKFFLHPDHSVVLLPKRPVSALRGIRKSERRAAPTIEEMDEAAAAGAVERCRRHGLTFRKP